MADSDAPLVATELKIVDGCALAVERADALTSTSIFGTMYDTRPRALVSHRSSTLQELTCWVLTPGVISSSGNLAVMSQMSRCPAPELVPPWKVRPFLVLAVKLTSTPLQ